MWSIIEFDDGIQLVPIDWFDNSSGTCKWPPYTSQIKIDKAIKHLEQPEETWSTHHAKKIFANADSYELGLKKLKKAELTSDLDTENDEIGKKLRKERARKIIESESSDSDNERKLKKFKVSGTTLVPVPKLTLSTSFDPSSNITHPKPSNSIATCSTPQPSTSSNTYVSTPKPNTSNSMCVSTASTSRSIQNDTPNSSSTFHTPTKVRKASNIIARKLSPYKHKKKDESDNYQTIIRKLNTILYEVRKLDERLSAIENKPIQSVNQYEIEAAFDDEFPLKTITDLDELESKLALDKENWNKVIMRLKVFAAVDVHQTVVNILRELMSNEVAVQFSFAGAKQKRSFKKLLLYKIVVAATRMKHTDALTSKIDETMSKWLVQATLRLSRQTTKKPRPSVETESQ